MVLERSRPGCAARLHQADCPGVAREHFAGRDRPLAHGRLPVHSAWRQTDLGEHEIDHAVHDVALVAHVAVQRHRLDAQLLGELAHAERLDAILIGTVEGGAQHSLTAQGYATLRSRVRSRRHAIHLSQHLACVKPIDNTSLHCYRNAVTLTVYAQEDSNGDT